MFPFSILGMGTGLSALGKLTCKFWKLGKVKTHKKYFQHKRIQLKCTVLCLKDSMALFFAKKRLKTFMLVLNFQLRIFQDFPIGNCWSAKKILFGIGNVALYWPQIAQTRNTEVGQIRNGFPTGIQVP